MRGVLYFTSVFLVLFYLFENTAEADKKGRSQKQSVQKRTQNTPADDETDYIRCDEEIYKKYSELRPRYIEIQKKIGEIDARLKLNYNNIERLKEMSDEEIDSDVRDENIRMMEEENSKMKKERKRLEEEGIEFYKVYEPIRHKCED